MRKTLWRITLPDAAVIRHVESAGMLSVRPHVLTPAELEQMQDANAVLLKRHEPLCFPAVRPRRALVESLLAQAVHPL